MSETACSPSRQLMPPTSLYGMKRRVGPDAILVEPATDAPGQRHEIAEVHEHHGFAEHLAMHDEDLERHEKAGGDTKPEGEPVVRRRRAGPDQQGTAPPAPIPHELEHEPSIRDQEIRRRAPAACL